QHRLGPRQAMRHLGGLREEGAFFAWVTRIIKHKIARKRRRALAQRRGRRRTRSLEPRGSTTRAGGLADPRARAPEESVEAVEEYLRLSSALQRLYPKYPRPMAAVDLYYLSGCKLHELGLPVGPSMAARPCPRRFRAVGPPQTLACQVARAIHSAPASRASWRPDVHPLDLARTSCHISGVHRVTFRPIVETST
ncbi:MAG: sigma-70 family RNA polymerase sigma factor, partial [Planctomycetes bacterium]|nr:sigma-70 family RNA polymerase sigma factor [Planctomycetota bacterium]